MNLLGIPIKHEVILFINEAGEIRTLVPKLQTPQEVMQVCQALVNQAEVIASMYGMTMKIGERTP